MHSVRFRDPAGTVRTGEWTDGGVHAAGQAYDPEVVEFLPPTTPSKIVCVGLNYAEHAAEIGDEVPDRPSVFLKGPNALAAHGSTVAIPDADRVDHEAELAAVIGERCRNVAESAAMDVVAGYTPLNDVSNRDVLSDPDDRDLFRGKAFDGAAPIGPAVAPPGALPDDARIACRVNGETRQDAPLSDLVFSVPELIADVSSHVTLEPGDVVSTGTPPGVGPLADGDTVEVDVDGIPTLRHGIKAP